MIVLASDTIVVSRCLPLFFYHDNHLLLARILLYSAAWSCPPTSRFPVFSPTKAAELRLIPDAWDIPIWRLRESWVIFVLNSMYTWNFYFKIWVVPYSVRVGVWIYTKPSVASWLLTLIIHLLFCGSYLIGECSNRERKLW